MNAYRWDSKYWVAHANDYSGYILYQNGKLYEGLYNPQAAKDGAGDGTYLSKEEAEKAIYLYKHPNINVVQEKVRYVYYVMNRLLDTAPSIDVFLTHEAALKFFKETQSVSYPSRYLSIYEYDLDKRKGKLFQSEYGTYKNQ